jgi:3-hydroxyisobutyrate dehydrogenase
MTAPRIGFIGLGNMGRRMAANAAKAGHALVVFDAAGTAERAPEGTHAAASVAEVAQHAEVVLLSLPDGAASAAVAAEIMAAEGRMAATVADTSTIGIDAARRVHASLAEAGIAYVDAPVSGGIAGAAQATLAAMVATDAATFARLEPLLGAMAGNVFHVGAAPGQGQAMKVLNNFLSATAMVATSEAMAFGVAQELDAALVIDVLNASSGQNTATLDKFPNRVLPEKFDAGFTNTLLYKDVSLYLESVTAGGTPGAVGRTVVDIWRRFTESQPQVDFTRVYPFVRGGD